MGTLEGGPKIVTDGLVLYLDAANTKSYISGSTFWYDLSKKGNNCTLVNGPTFNPNNAGGIVFDGVNDEGVFPIVNDFLFLNRSPYTLSVFANIISASNVFHGILNREYGGPRNGYNLWFYRDNPNLIAIASERWAGTGQKVAFVLLSNSECVNKWNHYCVTYDGNDLKFYLNGEFINGVFADGNITNTTGPLQIARRQTTNGNVNISNLQIYNRGLSANEVKQNFNTIKQRFNL
jgi:hypothetical protein